MCSQGLDQLGLDGCSLSLTLTLSRRRERELIELTYGSVSLSRLRERAGVRGKRLKTQNVSQLPSLTGVAAALRGALAV